MMLSDVIARGIYKMGRDSGVRMHRRSLRVFDYLDENEHQRESALATGYRKAGRGFAEIAWPKRVKNATKEFWAGKRMPRMDDRLGTMADCDPQVPPTAPLPPQWP